MYGYVKYFPSIKQNTLSRKLLEFNSLLTGDARSAILAGDPNTNYNAISSFGIQESVWFYTDGIPK